MHSIQLPKSFLFFLVFLQAVFCSLLLHTPTIAATPVRVVGVSDGDTIRVVADGQEVRVRLHGIDAPERGQDFGTVATKGLRSLLAGRQVSIEQTDIDRYGRTVAIVYADGLNVNEAMLTNGWAWVYPKYCLQGFCEPWRQMESVARADKKGLWRDPAPTPPWAWRAQQNTQQAAASASYSGNVHASASYSGNMHASAGYSGNVKSGVFHRSSCKHFRCKNCTRTFSSRQQALDAGFRPCGNCKP